MIFPEIKINDWIKRYPALEVVEDVCYDCGRAMKADIPFIEKNWAGLKAKDCECGMAGIEVTTPVSSESIELMKFRRIVVCFIRESLKMNCI